MAVASVTQWRVTPGKQQEFMGNVAQAKKIHERLGGTVSCFMNLFGGQDAGLVVYRVEHTDMSAHAAFSGKLAADAEWQRLWASAQAGGSATMAANSLLMEMPIGGRSGADQARMGVMAVVILQPAPGRQEQVQAEIEEAARILGGAGAHVRAWTAVFAGPRAGTIVATSGTSDLSAYATTYQKLMSGGEWQQFQATAAASGNLTVLSQSLVVQAQGV